MSVLERFKNLNNSEVSRYAIQDIIADAKKANQTEIVYRLSKILIDNPNSQEFFIELQQYPTSLNAPRHKGAFKDALTECGRLKKGWRFEKGSVVKMVKKVRKKPTTTRKPSKKVAKKQVVVPKQQKQTTKKSSVSKQMRLQLAGTAKNKETISFNKEIIKAKKIGVDPKKTYGLGQTKSVLKKHIGAQKITISGKVIIKAMEKDQDHIATYENFINFPDAINEPVAIFKSKTRVNSKVILTEIKTHKEKPLMVALHLNKDFGITRIASIYTKTNTSIYKKWFADGLCEYYNKKSSNELLQAPIAISHTVKGHNKDTKKKLNSNKKGLGKPILNPNSLAYKLANRSNRTVEYYDINDKDLADFLGKIERKEKESVVITVAGGQGSGKTRFAFRFMDALGQKYKVGHASIEEHPDSTLYWDKVHDYISEQALTNIANPEVRTVNELDKLIKENEVIIIDSFAKLQEIERGFEVDKDLRKKYDGKLFLVIFQQTSTGAMRGGTKSQYDGDIISFVEKFEDYKENYVYHNKNRYNNKPLHELKYNIYNGKLNDLPPIEKEEEKELI